jgi:hypothetical protein
MQPNPKPNPSLRLAVAILREETQSIRMGQGLKPDIYLGTGTKRFTGKGATEGSPFMPDGKPNTTAALNPEVYLGTEGAKARAPEVRLAHVPGAQGDNVLLGQRGVEQLPEESLPALLVSFFYLPGFLKVKDEWAYRDWAMDSGAFSAKNSGKEIDLDAYITKCKELRESDPKLTEIFALDVIGDWRASEENTKKMWAAGIEAIPCFHIGEPWDVLKGLAKDYPKIALGGVALVRGKRKVDWLTECFSRVWPKKIHGFGCSGRELIMSLPFHSVDATNWELAPCKFGNWHSFGELSVRGSTQNLRAEVEYFLNLERDARSRWQNEMALLERNGGSKA